MNTNENNVKGMSSFSYDAEGKEYVAISPEVFLILAQVAIKHKEEIENHELFATVKDNRVVYYDEKRNRITVVPKELFDSIQEGYDITIAETQAMLNYSHMLLGLETEHALLRERRMQKIAAAAAKSKENAKQKSAVKPDEQSAAGKAQEAPVVTEEVEAPVEKAENSKVSTKEEAPVEEATTEEKPAEEEKVITVTDLEDSDLKKIGLNSRARNNIRQAKRKGFRPQLKTDEWKKVNEYLASVDSKKEESEPPAKEEPKAPVVEVSSEPKTEEAAEISSNVDADSIAFAMDVLFSRGPDKFSEEDLTDAVDIFAGSLNFTSYDLGAQPFETKVTVVNQAFAKVNGFRFIPTVQAWVDEGLQKYQIDPETLNLMGRIENLRVEKVMYDNNQKKSFKKGKKH